MNFNYKGEGKMKELKLVEVLEWVAEVFGDRVSDISTSGDRVELHLRDEDVYFRFVQIEGGDFRVVTFQGGVVVDDKMVMDLDTLRDNIETQCDLHRITTRCDCCGRKVHSVDLIAVLNKDTGYEDLLCEDCYIERVVDEIESEAREQMR